MVNRCAASAPHTPNPDYRPDRLASVIIREYQLSRRAISAIDGDDAAYHPENEFLAMFHRDQQSAEGARNYGHIRALSSLN